MLGYRNLFSLRDWSGMALFAVFVVSGLGVACGTDFVEPPPIAAQVETPTPVATVLRVIPVTPVPTPTPLATAVGPDGAAQRDFPAEIDPANGGNGLPVDAVMGYWREYLADARVIVEGRPVDLHTCMNGDMIFTSQFNGEREVRWGLRPTNDEWFEVYLGTEFRPGRVSALVRLSRVGGSTVAIAEDGTPGVVSVTDSDLCTETGGS